MAYRVHADGFSTMRRLILIASVIVCVAACAERPGFLQAQTPHEAYADSLEKAGLHETALGRGWIAAGEAALREAREAKLPLEAAAPFRASEIRALGYRLDLKRGRVLRIEIAAQAETPTLIFVDLFRAPEKAGEEPDHVASARRGELIFEREIDRDGVYLLRIQPELLRGGTLKITQRTTAALGFPVAGRSSTAVQSYFRDPREGGRREHHGVDIFAPRDTPVLAASGGLVSSVSTTNLGGHVVWVWDARRRQSHYYAHLSRQAVRPGEIVQAGDVIGYVGNTGNARTTPPHLHFGIYAMGAGPIDPLPFVQGAKAAAN
jgi:murein DD-endopeptidase MepM/ murein hydrolase activator NlpD